MEYKQLSIFDFLTEMDNQREKLNIEKSGCYIFAMIKNAVPYFTKNCDSEQRCGLCKIDKEYVALRGVLTEQGYAYFDAITRAKEMMHAKYDEQFRKGGAA